MSTGRSSLAAVAINMATGAGPSLLATGGRGLNSCESFELTRWRWRQGPSMALGRESDFGKSRQPGEGNSAQNPNKRREQEKGVFHGGCFSHHVFYSTEWTVYFQVLVHEEGLKTKVISLSQPFICETFTCSICCFSPGVWYIGVRQFLCFTLVVALLSSKLVFFFRFLLNPQANMHPLT